MVDKYAGELFSLVVLDSDGLLVVPETANANIKKFFELSRRLTLDLQLTLCNRAFRVARDVIHVKDTEAGFKRFGRAFAIEELMKTKTATTTTPAINPGHR